MNCPVCNVELKMTERQGVEIDYCPNCRGVWLDRGELDKIIDRSAPERHRDEGHGEHSRHDDDYRQRRGKKRESFLSDLFDF